MSQVRKYSLGELLLNKINADIPEEDRVAHGCSSVVVKVNNVQQDVTIEIEMQSGDYVDVADNKVAPLFGLESVT